MSGKQSQNYGGKSSGNGNGGKSSGGGSGGAGQSGGKGGKSNETQSATGWQKGYMLAYEHAYNGVNNGEYWGYGRCNNAFSEGYMRGWQETYGDKN